MMLSSGLNRRIGFTAPCPRCGQPCDWHTAVNFDGINMTPPAHEVRCGCAD